VIFLTATGCPVLSEAKDLQCVSATNDCQRERPKGANPATRAAGAFARTASPRAAGAFARTASTAYG